MNEDDDFEIRHRKMLDLFPDDANEALDECAYMFANIVSSANLTEEKALGLFKKHLNRFRYDDEMLKALLQ